MPGASCDSRRPARPAATSTPRSGRAASPWLEAARTSYCCRGRTSPRRPRSTCWLCSGANTVRSASTCRGSRASRRGNVHGIATPGPWLRELIDALALERPTVVGHSLAARVALLAARGDPSIGGLVLVNPAGLIRLRVGPAALAATMYWLLRRDEASAARLLRRMAGPGAHPRADLAAWTALVGRHVRTSLAPPPLPAAALAEVRCPVRLVAGRHDPFLPAQRLMNVVKRFDGPTAGTVVEKAKTPVAYVVRSSTHRRAGVARSRRAAAGSDPRAGGRPRA